MKKVFPENAYLHRWLDMAHERISTVIILRDREPSEFEDFDGRPSLLCDLARPIANSDAAGDALVSRHVAANS